MATPHRPPRRILCVRLRSMGDTILMTPALGALRRHFPGAEIHVVLDRSLAALLQNHPDVDQVHGLGRTLLDKMSLAHRLRLYRFDAVVNFHGGPTSALLTAATGAPTRVGRDLYRYGFVYTCKVQNPEIVFGDPRATHAVHTQASLVSALGIEARELSLRLVVSEPARRRIVQRLEAHGAGGTGYVVLQPTASFPSKQWPAERFVELARALHEQSGRELVWTLPASPRLGRRERTLALWRRVATSVPSVGSLQERLGGGFPVLADLPFDELTALIDGSVLYVGSDSGPMHLAAALGKPVVGIYGSSDPRRWHPWGVPHRTLWAGLDCSPCHGKWCANPERFACLERIRVEDVLEAALELLNDRSSCTRPSKQEPHPRRP